MKHESSVHKDISLCDVAGAKRVQIFVSAVARWLVPPLV